MLAIEQVHAAYPGFTLSVSQLRLRMGRVYGLVGHNGAGKSTLMKIVAGILDTPDNSIRVADELLNGALERRKRIAFAPDKPALYDWMTVGEFVSFYCAATGTDRAEVREALSRFQVSEKKLIRQLSHGNRAKIGIITTLKRPASFVFLDEPLGPLDLEVRQELLEYIRDEVGRASGRGFLFSSHHVADLEELADDIILLNNGRCRLEQSLAEIRGGYLTEDSPIGQRKRVVWPKDHPPERAEARPVRAATVKGVFLHFAGNGGL